MSGVLAGAASALDPIERTASYSRDRRYRYALGRRWGVGPVLTWVMLNPSTADHRRDDPTIRRCTGFARAWGFGGLRVVNLFALRTPDPRLLVAAEDPVGPGADRVLRRALRSSDAVIAAWGNPPPPLRRRADEVRRWLPGGAWCLGLTARGEPRHPLYAAAGLEPRLLAPEGATLSVFGGPPTMAA